MRRRYLRPGVLAGHVLVLLAALTCLRLGWWQWDVTHEARGTIQNFGYALLWPTFGAAFIFMWIRFLQLEQIREREAEEVEAGGAPFGDPDFGDSDFGDSDFGDPAFGDPDFGDPDFGDTAEIAGVDGKWAGGFRTAPGRLSGDGDRSGTTGARDDHDRAGDDDADPGPVAFEDARSIRPDSSVGREVEAPAGSVVGRSPLTGDAAADSSAMAAEFGAEADGTTAKRRRSAARRRRSQDRPSQSVVLSVATVGGDDDDDDPELAAYNRALAELAEKDRRAR